MAEGRDWNGNGEMGARSGKGSPINEIREKKLFGVLWASHCTEKQY